MHPNSPRLGFPHLDLPSPSHPGPAWNKKASPVVDKSKWVTIGLSLRVLPSRRPFSARQNCLFSCATKRRGRWSVSCTGSQERVSRRIATVLSRREVPVRIPPFVAVKERGIPAASRALDRKNERRSGARQGSRCTGNAIEFLFMHQWEEYDRDDSSKSLLC